MTKLTLGLGIGAVAVVVIAGYLIMAPSKKDGPSLADIERGTATYIKVRGAIGAAVAAGSDGNAAKGDVHVVSAECTKLGMTVADENAPYRCSVHYKWSGGAAEDHTITFHQMNGQWIPEDIP